MLQGRQAVRAGRDGRTLLFQNALRDLQIDVAVIDHQHAHACQPLCMQLVKIRGLQHPFKTSGRFETTAFTALNSAELVNGRTSITSVAPRELLVVHIRLRRSATIMTGGSSPMSAFLLEPCDQLMCIHVMQMQLHDQYVRPRFRGRVAHTLRAAARRFPPPWTPTQRARHGEQTARCITARVDDEDSQAACAERASSKSCSDSKGYLDPECAAHC
jgi:hypothetical protein